MERYLAGVAVDTILYRPEWSRCCTCFRWQLWRLVVRRELGENLHLFILLEACLISKDYKLQHVYFRIYEQVCIHNIGSYMRIWGIELGMWPSSKALWDANGSSPLTSIIRDY